jgi:hypothetical protein
VAERIIFPEFRDELEPTNYPFADGASLLSQDGTRSIGKTTFLDASLYPIGSVEGMYISAVEVTLRAITFRISDRANRNLCYATFNPLHPPDVLEVWDDYGRPAGVLLSEPLRLSQFGAWDNGTHTFDRQTTEFCASCVIPTPEIGVRGILTENGELLTGDVWIVGENGIAVRELVDGQIRIDVIGDPMFVRKQCDPLELFEPPLFIKTINHCPPNADGDFRIEANDDDAPETIMRIVHIDDGLQIEAVGQYVRRAD